MADIGFSLADLFASVWGYKSEAFAPNFPAVTGDKKLSRAEFGKQGSPYYKNDANGRECFLPASITYAQPQGTDPGGNVIELNKTIDLPYPIVSISCRRKFIETELTERDGTAVELINTGNYEINIKGFVINKNNEFPEDGINQLRELWEKKRPVSLSCVMTDIFLMQPGRGGSDNVVIREIRLPEVKGIKNVRPYELIMFSDLPFNLIEIV